MLKRGNVLSVEMSRAVQDVVRQHLSSWQPRPVSQRRRRFGGGGGETANLTSVAIVTQQVGQSQFNSSGITRGTIGKVQLLDAIGDLTDEEEIEVRGRNTVPMPVGTIVVLDSIDPIKPGTTWPAADVNEVGENEARVWASFVRAVDELYQLPGQDSNTVLSIPESSTSADNIRWEPLGCETIQIVTDVACVDGEIMVTTSGITYASCG